MKRTQPSSDTAEAWQAHDKALALLDVNHMSWPARQLYLTALRRLRQVDPGFRHRPSQTLTDS